MRYVIGLVFVLVGFVVVWKSEWFLTQFGRIPWAEEHLGTEGGTRLFYKLIGIAVILISFLYMGGFIEGIILRIFAPTLPRQ